jgi:hypothetical protein
MACSCCCLMAAAVAGCVQHPPNPKMVFFNTTKPLERLTCDHTWYCLRGSCTE